MTYLSVLSAFSSVFDSGIVRLVVGRRGMGKGVLLSSVLVVK